MYNLKHNISIGQKKNAGHIIEDELYKLYAEMKTKHITPGK
jgi:hypothetical protein